MLITNAEIESGRCADVRIVGDSIAQIGNVDRGRPGELAIDAEGAALLPGLHDHHFHLLAYAASRDSVRCGPPTVRSGVELADALYDRQSAFPGDWIRGVGYHRSAAGDIDRDWLDRVVAVSPARIQDRSGRLWILNSRALEIVAPAGTETPLEIIDGRFTGRLYDGDAWLRERIGKTVPPIRAASEFLLSRGVTGITDTTPENGPAEFELLRNAKANGDLVQDILFMGGTGLDTLPGIPGLRTGARKIHLHETDLPDLDDLSDTIRQSHKRGRPVAIHCVTLAELVFALGAFHDAGALRGDRIEHAAIAPPDILPSMAKLGVTVVTQPNFIRERGNAYLTDVDPTDRHWLYRLRGFRDAGIPLAAGTDAPFGDADPWKAMQAAVTRRTGSGAVIGEGEALTPDEALALFTGEPDDPGGPPRVLRVGAAADLCLIDRPWREARTDLSKVEVAKTIKAGRIVWSR
jgi:predicted amidohydrolase YtcJ